MLALNAAALWQGYDAREGLVPVLTTYQTRQVKPKRKNDSLNLSVNRFLVMISLKPRINLGDINILLSGANNLCWSLASFLSK
jgi:hypothetical protein